MALGVALATAVAGAQSPAPLGRVEGVVFDSLLRAPLPGASVTAAGVTRVATSGRDGKFALDSVPAGIVVLSFSHPDLDSLGVSGLSTTATVGPGATARVRLATPSLASLHRRYCGAVPATGADSGIVFGVVTNAETDSVVPRGTVEMSWLSISNTRSRKVLIDAPTLRAETDDGGAYIACGVATGLALSIVASTRSAASGETERILSPTRPVARHDLLVSRDLVLAAAPRTPSAADTGDAANAARERTDSLTPPNLPPRGTAAISGTVRDSEGVLKSGARVLVLGVAGDFVTGESGHFYLGGLPAGSQTLEVRALGSALVRQIVGLRARDTTRVDVVLRRATALRAVSVIARMPLGRDLEGFERRKRVGWGRYVGEEQLDRLYTMSSMFGAQSGVRIVRGRSGETILMRSFGRDCVPVVFIDGFRADVERLVSSRPYDFVGVEIYRTRTTAPVEFQDFVNGECGSIVVWTKAGARWH